MTTTTNLKPARWLASHPAIVCSGPQLESVIAELEAGTYPQPDDAIWRGDLPRALAVRLAKATGATDEQIAAIIAEPQAKEIPAEPTTWLVAVTGGGSTEHTEYRNGKDAHRVASDRSRPPEVDHATVTFNGCVTTYRNGTGTGPGEAASEPEPEPEQDAEPAPGCTRLTIRHTHEDGTLIYGTDKGDGVYEIVRQWSGGRFRDFPSIRMIGIAQSRDRLAKRGQIQMAAEALRKAGHVVTVEIDDTPRDVAEVKADRADRLDDRYERLTTKATRLQAEGDARHATADRISERFAGGQPIIRGHHSERGARRDHKRMEDNDRAAGVAYGKAERAASAASVVGSADAYRELPAVIRRRIDNNEAELRKTNHHINGTRPANDWRGAYSYDRKPATGAWLEQLTARKTFLEHQLDADRAALAEHQANGYVLLTRESVHKGDVVKWGATWGDGIAGATVTRVNPKTVTLNRRSYPRTLPYERIKSVQCPHEGTTTEVRARKPAAERREPVTVQAERPAERPAPLVVDRSTEFFPTPPAVVERMIAAAGLGAGVTVLEPSAGAGAIASAVAPLVAAVDCIERNGQLADVLRASGAPRCAVRCADFLEVAPEPVYDRVMMNPPFGNRADVRHVLHALGFLRPGGRLVAIMGAGAAFRDDKLTAGLRELIRERGGTIEALPDDSFEPSGTSVRTVLVTIPGETRQE